LGSVREEASVMELAWALLALAERAPASAALVAALVL
jgi:hypothetical protein